MPRQTENAVDDARLQLEPAPTSARVWLFALTVALPLAITLLALGLGFQSNAPKRLVAGSEAATWLAALGGVAVLVSAIWVILDRLLRRHRLVLGVHALDIKTGFNRCTVAYTDLKPDAARIVDLAERSEYRPMLRLNGTGLPGFRSGWYLLRDRSRAFVAITRGRRVLWIPTRKHALLLQPREPQALLDALRARAMDDARGD